MQQLQVNIDDLTLDECNARTHDSKSIQAIAKSLDRFGQQKPIVVDGNNVVIAGNGTLQAAKTLHWEMIYVVKTELTGKDARAFAIADNRTTDLSGWNYTELIDQLGNLDEDMQDIAGFDADAIADLIDLPPAFGEDNKQVGIKDGEMVTMGDCTLTCDSSVTPLQMAEMLDGMRLPPSVCTAVERYWTSKHTAGG